MESADDEGVKEPEGLAAELSESLLLQLARHRQSAAATRKVERMRRVMGNTLTIYIGIPNKSYESASNGATRGDARFEANTLY